MAAVFIPPSPQTTDQFRTSRSKAMANDRSQRKPLANVPNATNSPFRGITGGTSGKRSRGTMQDQSHHGQPPSKRQMLKKDDVESASQQQHRGSIEGRVFTGRSLNPPTPFEQQLHAVAAEAQDREKENRSRSSKSGKVDKVAAESIRAWREHYKTAFPTYVFYFDNVSEDTRARAVKAITKFGAREEKFFSRAVTHVVTTRMIPPDNVETTSIRSTSLSSAGMETASLEPQPQPQTINPTLLEKAYENASQANGGPLNAKSPHGTTHAGHARRPLPQEPEMRKDNSTKNDVLLKARHFQMKIWALEKLSRVMQTLNDVETNQHTHNTRSQSSVSTGYSKHHHHEENLTQVLKNERIHGHLDRDASVSTKELVPFRGPFIYIHDIDEKHKPVMIREYPPVANRREGEWPQFRSAPQGKCPFVEDPQLVKEIEEARQQEREERRARKLAAKQQRQEDREASVGCSMAHVERPSKMDPPASRSALRDVIGQINKTNPGKQVPMPRSIQENQTVNLKRESSGKGSEAFPPPGFSRPRMYGGEPAASGVQPSNITSAIRSQMISSTAAAPGAKAGTSKEVHELHRKVLERSNSGLSVNGNSNSQRMVDISASLKANPPTTREAKRKAQQKLGLGQINEEGVKEGDPSFRPRAPVKSSRKKSEKRDPKPGYCENCHEKFNDFEEHVASRKHRKFALTASNWVELDDLLSELIRPWKDDNPPTHLRHLHEEEPSSPE